jgi:hypothetical protein
MGLLSSNQDWTSQARIQDKNRKANAKAKQARAARARRDNRKHMIEHPASHIFRSIFR